MRYDIMAETLESVEPVTVLRKLRLKSTDSNILYIPKFLEFISKIENPKIILLRNKEVVQWVFGDTSFLPAIEKTCKTNDGKKYKILEDKWGKTLMNIHYPKLKCTVQWTNKFGEYLAEEIYTLLGKRVSIPATKDTHKPDLEVEDAIIEAKTETFYTTGTAGEKILGCPFKYAEVPVLYNKPLIIICLGGAEKACREEYGNLPGTKTSVTKKKFLDFFRENRIEYIGASDILKSLSS
jgi:hypothetical protein